MESSRLASTNLSSYDKQHRPNTPTRCLISLLWYIPGQGRLYTSTHNLACCTCAALLRITTTFPSQKAAAISSLTPRGPWNKAGSLAGNSALSHFQVPVSSNKNKLSWNFREKQNTHKGISKNPRKNGTKRQLYFSAKTHPKLRCSLFIRISTHTLKTLYRYRKKSVNDTFFHHY